MKKSFISILLIATMVLTSCAQNVIETPSSTPTTENSILNIDSEVVSDLVYEYHDTLPTFNGLSDENLLGYLEDDIYRELIEELDSTDYVVEDVKAIYIPKEYLDLLESNSLENEYFGYTVSELNEMFPDTQYVFDVDEEGHTYVHEVVGEQENPYLGVAKNIAIGTGVILICVVITYVTDGAGYPAAAAIFAASAKGGAIAALSGGLFAGVTSGVVTGLQTGDFDQALEKGIVDGSEGFMWGAVVGAAAGGMSEGFTLWKGTASGLTMDEVALIQKENKLPMDVIKQINSMEEYNIYKESGLFTSTLDGKTILARAIDLEYISPKANGLSNLELMQNGNAPYDSITDQIIQLHHIGQKPDGTLAMLIQSEHQGNASILNWFTDTSLIGRDEFGKERAAFWKKYVSKLIGG